MAVPLLHKLLLENEFQRTATPLSYPIIIFGTAGSGKTTIIRLLAAAYPDLHFSSFRPCLLLPNTRRSQVAANPLTPTDVLDEFLAGPNPAVSLAKFCDPLQYNCTDLPLPHYTSNHTYRFCPATCDLLNQLFSTTLSSRLPTAASITRPDPYSQDPSGTVVALEQDLLDILKQHGAFPKKPAELTGQTLPAVAFYCSSLQDAYDADPAATFIALTRHTTKLEIFELDARPDPTA
ncbi:triple-gene-block protein 1 [Lettuce virus X]|uniref:Triple gene block 1 protein n=1 Tax=Lettuce virus X TaxID=447171 RepID=B3CJG3_9VIRU|nr:triple-gene-block protein 1 [Lettuce virus X]QWT83781.1 triple gene block 1 protein [Lettuce virus X]CAN88809.1 triple-gene-block protein 1 [Lettuce virus X]